MSGVQTGVRKGWGGLVSECYMNASFAAFANLTATTTNFSSAATVMTRALRGLSTEYWHRAYFRRADPRRSCFVLRKCMPFDWECESMRWVARFDFRRCSDGGPWLPLGDPGDGAGCTEMVAQVLGHWGWRGALLLRL